MCDKREVFISYRAGEGERKNGYVTGVFQTKKEAREYAFAQGQSYCMVFTANNIYVGDEVKTCYVD